MVQGFTKGYVNTFKGLRKGAGEPHEESGDSEEEQIQEEFRRDQIQDMGRDESRK